MADFDVHYDPITVNMGDTTVDVKGLDNVKGALALTTPEGLKLGTDSDVKLEQTLQSESRLDTTGRLDTTSKLDLAIREPIRTESRAELDIKPLALDQCVRVSFGPLPPTCVVQPYEQRFGFTVFGVEIFGFSLSGESRLVIPDASPKPHVVHGVARPVGHKPAAQKQAAPRVEGGELRIRLGD